MSVSVQEIVNLPIFNTAKVLTGIELLDQREVDWMSAIERPVENFVRKNEFILTTGVGCEEDPQALYEFVLDVYESGAAALGIAVGRYIFDIPEEIITFAEQNDFILMELPWELRFADLQRETMKLINESKERSKQGGRDIQRQLIDFVIQGRTLIQIFRFFEQKMQCKLTFFDSKGRLQGTGDDPEKLVRAWQNYVNKEKVQYAKPSFLHVEKIVTSKHCLLKKNITSTSRSSTEGYFVVEVPSESAISNELLHGLESLSAATALWISREDAIVKTEMRLRNEFIWGLAANELKSEDLNVQSRAKLFGYNITVPYLCAVGSSDNFDELTEKEYRDIDAGFKSIIYYIEEEVRQAAETVNRHVAFTFHNDRLIIFLEAGKAEQKTVHHFLDLVDKRLHELIPGVVFTWGIGMHSDGLNKFHQSYKKASSALDLALSQKEPGGRVHFEDTQLNRLLLHLANNEEVREITKATIAPLIEYEKNREMDLINTFIAYDNQNGNVSQAARVLNLHRQSLLYRLRKIESLTNLSLDHPDDVFLLNISIKVWLTGAFQVEDS